MRAVTFATGVFFCSTLVIAAAALSQAQPSGERAVTLYVGTDGSDAWSGRLSYWPRDGEDMGQAEIVAPLLHELLRFDGDADAGKLVEHVQVVGLSFKHADWSLPDAGFGDPQAAVTVPAVVTANGYLRTSEAVGEFCAGR